MQSCKLRFIKEWHKREYPLLEGTREWQKIIKTYLLDQMCESPSEEAEEVFKKVFGREARTLHYDLDQRRNSNVIYR